MKKRTHFDPFREGLRTACRIEDRGPAERRSQRVANLLTTSDADIVTCLSCEDTPEYEAARHVADTRKRDSLQDVRLVHDRLMLLELRDHRTLDQLRAWSIYERADVAVWAGRRHLRASDNAVTVPPRPEVMNRDPGPVITLTAGDGLFGPIVCRCDKDETA